jgi:hypothetical protein
VTTGRLEFARCAFGDGYAAANPEVVVERWIGLFIMPIGLYKQRSSTLSAAADSLL